MYAPLDDIDNQNARPDFMALIYPVITMGDKTHEGSKENLLGKNPSQSMVNAYSNQLLVNSGTPHTFLVHAMDDKVVPRENNEYFHALLSVKGNGEGKSLMILYHKGGHGFGLAEGMPNLEEWPKRLITWINTLEKD